MIIRPVPLRVLIVIAFLVGVPFADLANGFFVSQFGTSNLAIIYKALIIPLSVILLSIRAVGKKEFLFTVTIWIGTALLFVTSSKIGETKINFVEIEVLSRGPLLLSFVFLLLRFLSKNEATRAVYTYFKVSWWVIAGSIICLSFTGMSLATYAGSDFNIGSKGYYVAGNELTIVFVLSWWFIVFQHANSRATSYAYTLATLGILYIIGTKAGFAFIGIIFLWLMMLRLKITPLMALFAFSSVVCVVVISATNLFLILGPHLKGWERLSYFIDRYGVATTLTGGRFLILPKILTVFSDFNIIDVVFGMGFESFWNAVGIKSTECDFIDLFGGSGLLGIMLFYGVLFYFLTLALRANKLDKWGGVLLAIVLYSIFVGHVAFAATPAICVAAILSSIWEECHSEDSNYPILVQ